MSRFVFICHCLCLLYFAIGAESKQKKCVGDEFQCSNGETVLVIETCDGKNDCSDGSDEVLEICEVPMEVRLVGGVDESIGRLEIKYLGKWGNIWNLGFTDDDAKIVCHMLGYDGPASVIHEVLGTGLERTWMGAGLNCNGSESSIDDCEKPTQAGLRCDVYEDAAVACSPGPVMCGIGNSHAVGRRYKVQNFPKATFTKIADHHPTGRSLLPRNSQETFNVSHDRIRRITNGKVANSPEDFPWIADLSLFSNKLTFNSRTIQLHLCGAVIISEYFVLTAAHCLTRLKEEIPNWTSVLKVSVGEYDQTQMDIFEETFDVDRVIIHPKYDGKELINDIALIKIKPRGRHGIHFNKHVQPICLPSVDIPLVDEMLAVAGGWGITQTGMDIRGELSRYLRLAQVPLLSPKLCKKYSGRGNYDLKPGHLCAGHKQGRVNTCRGDSGGPLIISLNDRFTLVGITSFGPSACSLSALPGVYADVRYYVPWILSSIKRLSA